VHPAFAIRLLLIRGRDVTEPTRDATILGRPQPEPVAAG
jgi:hypothetical protein